MPPKDVKPPETDTFVEIVSMLFLVIVAMTIIGNITRNLETNKLYANGWAGLTPRGVLISHTSPISSLENPIGARVVSINTTQVYSSPNGEKIGSHSISDRGKILQGPVDINGVRYWYVDYDKDPDGWVKESDIAHLDSEPSLLERIYISFVFWIFYLKVALFIFSVIFLVVCVYLFRKITELRVTEDKLLYPKSPEVLSAVNPKWQHILDLMESINQNDWKQGILEADIMLADILDRMSLPGDTIGDKLKAVERSDFTTIDNAWEAHKVRNQIAHEGADFVLNQREVLRVMNLYKTVFEEFQII